MGWGGLETPLWSFQEAADAVKGPARSKRTLQRELGAEWSRATDLLSPETREK